MKLSGNHSFASIPLPFVHRAITSASPSSCRPMRMSSFKGNGPHADIPSMQALNEMVFVRDYMRVTECSEGQARSVYIFMDALAVTEEAEGSDGRETTPRLEPVSQERSSSPFSPAESGRIP